MNFLKYFTNEKEEEVKKYSLLHDKIQRSFPDLSEKEVLTLACISGLFARVAYVDFKLDAAEIKKMQTLFEKTSLNPSVSPKIIVEMAIEHIKEMAGIENHLYVHPLNEVLNADQKFQVLQCLFLIAASDGVVEEVESEEIKLISKGMELSNQHFLAARAEVAEFLKSLM